MDRLANAVILSWGWRRRGIAFGAGALSALAMPPFFLFPILWLTFPLLVWLIDGAVAQAKSGRVRRLAPAFAAGWWFGLGYFLAGLWWVGAAFLVEPHEFGWLLLPALFGLAAGLALFWGFGAALAQLLWSEDWRRVFALAAGLGVGEWLRGHLFSGFPWNAIGYALTAGEVLMQSAALLGIYALSVAAVAIFAAPAVLAPTTSERRRNAILPALAILCVAALGLYGFLRIANAEPTFVPDVSIRIVQPALEQLQKWNPDNKDAVLSTYFRLSVPDATPLQSGTLLVWPESAFPVALTREPSILAAIAELLPEDTTLVTGAYRVENTPGGTPQVFNTIYVIGADGTILDSYDKVHLVPFGEYLPASDLLAPLGLSQLVPDGFLPGRFRRPLNPPVGPPFAPLICYEIIFSGAVLGEGPRPGFLLNLTNDGWFGRTTGPYQHFHQARVRGVEEGLPLVRAANTGLSALTDPYGRVVAASRVGEATALQARLPAAIRPTFYANWRGTLVLILLALCVSLAGTKFLYPVSRA